VEVVPVLGLVAVAIEADGDAAATTRAVVAVELDHAAETGTQTETETGRDALATSERLRRGQKTAWRLTVLRTNCR
jgi:hypothetical protein